MIGATPLGRGASMREAVMTLAHERGLAIVQEQGRLAGVITAGDLTRLAEQQPDFLSLPVERVMTRTPKTAAPDDLAASAVGRMERYGIMVLPVIDPDGTVLGVVHLHDLMRAGAV